MLKLFPAQKHETELNAVYIRIGMIEIYHWVKLEAEYQVYTNTPRTKLVDRKTWYDLVILGHLV